MKYKIVGSSLQDHDTRLFLQALIPYLRGHGHKLVDAGEDVVLSFGHSCDQGTKTALRWDSTCDSGSLNPNVNAVIFSSNHEMIVSKIGHNNCHIIGTGLDIELKSQELPTGLQSIRQDYESVITLPIVEGRTIDSSLIIEIYENIKLISGKKCCLIIMSNDEHCVGGNDVFHVPWLRDVDRNSLFSMSNFVLYLDRGRANPHELCESLSQGTRIVTLGQKEIGELVKEYAIPSLFVTKPPQEYPWDLQHIDIRNVSKKYSDVIFSL